MPPKGTCKFTPEQLNELFTLYKAMPLAEAAERCGMTYASAFYQMQKRGLLCKPFSSVITQHPCTLTDRELYYLAGLVDGEGTVTIRKLAGRKWIPCVIVSNTDTRMMDWLLEVFREVPSAWVTTVGRERPNRARAYAFWVNGLGHLPLYQALEPALVIKADLMRLVIEWTELRLTQTQREPLTPRQFEIISLIRARNMKPSKRSPIAA